MQRIGFEILTKINWLTFCHLIQAFCLFVLNTILVTKFFYHTDLALYFLLFSASTVTINHFRWAIPTFLLKNITNPFSEQLKILIAMILISLIFSTVQFHFISGKFDLHWWYLYIYSAFLVNYFANFLASLEKYWLYGISLLLSGAIIASASGYIYIYNTFSVLDLSLIFALSQLVPAVVMGIPVIYYFSSKQNIKDEPIEKSQLISYIKFILYEAPTRPIPFIEKYIANLISPTALISIEIIQRLCLRPVSLLLVGKIFRETVVILRDNKSIFLSEVAKAIFGNNYLKITTLVLLPIMVLFCYNLFNPLSAETYFVATVMLMTLFLVNILDIYRKKFVAEGYVDRIMVVNLIVGVLNILFLLLLYFFGAGWVFISIGALLNAILTLVILHKLQMSGERT